jgi:uncharacterized protein (DUF1778 family)
MELRTTEEERALIDRAVAVAGTDLTEFVVAHASEAARRVLADRQSFELDPAALEAWEKRDHAAVRARDWATSRAYLRHVLDR